MNCFSINISQSVGRMGEKSAGWNLYFFNVSNEESSIKIFDLL